MSLKNALEHDKACEVCGFLLWEPIASSIYSKLGFYNDDRFPGRCILELSEHRDSFESLPMNSMLGFVRDIQIAIQAIRIVTGAKRVNVAILGNRDPHLHAHLIPRFPSQEEFPDCSPWNDPRSKGYLSGDEVTSMKQSIFQIIDSLDSQKEVDHWKC